MTSSTSTVGAACCSAACGSWTGAAMLAMLPPTSMPATRSAWIETCGRIVWTSAERNGDMQIVCCKAEDAFFTLKLNAVHSLGCVQARRRTARGKGADTSCSRRAVRFPKHGGCDLQVLDEATVLLSLRFHIGQPQQV